MRQNTCHISTKMHQKITKQEAEEIVLKINSIYENNKEFLEIHNTDKVDKYNISVIPKNSPSILCAFSFYTEYSKDPKLLVAEQLLMDKPLHKYWKVTIGGHLGFNQCQITGLRHLQILSKIFLEMNRITNNKFKIFIGYSDS